VSEALARAEQWAGRAEGRPAGTSQEAAAALGVWGQAEAAVAEAETALRTGVAEEALRQRVADVRQRLELGRHRTEQRRTQALRKETLLRALEAARLGQATLPGTTFHHARRAAQYRAAFSAFGLAVQPGRTAELARRIRAEEPAVREALLFALDDWATFARLARTEPSAGTLQNLAGAADNDAWRKRYRTARVNWDQAALRELSTQARTLSLPASSLCLLAKSLRDVGEYDEALALQRWARGRYPSDFWIPYDLGFCLIKAAKGKALLPLEIEEGIGCYRVAVALRPDVSAAHHNLGNWLIFRGQWDEAIPCYRQAVALDPRNVSAHIGLGAALKQKGRLDEAIIAYRRALALDSDHANAHEHLGNALLDKKQWDEAIACFHKALALDANRARIHFNLGNALAGKKQWDKALACFRQALALEPRHAEAHYALGNALKQQGRLEEAIVAYRQAIALDPRYADPHNNLGTTLATLGRLDDAMTAFRKAITLDPQDATAHLNLGMALIQRKQWDDALACFRKARDLGLVDAHFKLGQALLRKGRFAQALASTQQAIQLLPEDHRWRPAALQQRQRCRRFLAWEAKLPDVLVGKVQPANLDERLGFAEVCHLQQRHATAARLYAAAFAAATRADDLNLSHRYAAACAAVLAAAGQGNDAGKLTAAERSRWRQQALDWLRAGLGVCRKCLADGTPAERQGMRQMLQHCQRNTDLASVRDAAALKKLPAGDQEEWRKLWADVAALLQKTGGKK
jgi:tetratricopeptide (TPR) repeat protein